MLPTLVFALLTTWWLVGQPDVFDNQSGVIFVQPDQIEWKEAHPLLPGAYTAVVFGDPKKSGLYVIRLKLPANYQVPPHRHSQDEYITIISGSLNVGIGNKFDRSTSTFLPIEGSIFIPNNISHFAWTTDEMIMEIHAMGPRDTAFVDPNEPEDEEDLP
jgi:quercetin dioxygenase-like cupin family protein